MELFCFVLTLLFLMDNQGHHLNTVTPPVCLSLSLSRSLSLSLLDERVEGAARFPLRENLSPFVPNPVFLDCDSA